MKTQCHEIECHREQDLADERDDRLSRLHQAVKQTRVGEATVDREHRLFTNSTEYMADIVQGMLLHTLHIQHFASWLSQEERNSPACGMFSCT